MPIEVNIGHLLVGHNLKTVKEGEEATLVVREFVSSDDLELFKTRVNGGIPQALLSNIPADRATKILPVTSMLAILRRDTTATLYLDTIPGDPTPVLRVRPKTSVKSGDPVDYDNIADIVKVEYQGVSFPVDTGIVAVFRAGARQGLFYDLAPLHDDKKPREFDVEKALASFFCYLQQKHLFELDDADWQYLFDSQWFPFITLKAETRKQICEQAKGRIPLDDLMTNIVEDVKDGCQTLREKIRTHSIFSAHSALLEHALDKYLEGDYVSSTSLLYPRIEGVLRSVYATTGNTTDPTQTTLTTATIQARGDIDASGILLLPKEFLKYLKKVYFAGFAPTLAGLDPDSPAPVSRNSVGHGVAPQSYFNQKSATIGLLIIDQISYFLPDENPGT